jgi:DNA-binding NtrC family response regulator
MEASFLLVSGAEGVYWHQVLEKAVACLGTVDIVEEQDAIEFVSQRCYDIVILDTTMIEDVWRLFAQIREERPDAQIVIATSMPTWRRARAAFRMGALDYIRKSPSEDEVRSVLESALEEARKSTRCQAIAVEDFVSKDESRDSFAGGGQVVE